MQPGGSGEGSGSGDVQHAPVCPAQESRPDLQIKSLRGNLQTRLRKLKQGDYDAIVLAEAGVQRMGYQMEYSLLDPESFVPSANQGTIAVVARKGSQAEEYTRPLDHETTRAETMIERRILETVGGGCVVPMAVHARVQGRWAQVVAEVLSMDGVRFVRLEETVSLQEGYLERAGQLGGRLMEMGGRELVAEAVRAFGR